MESISILSNDFTEEIDQHLQNGFRYRKLANEAVQVEDAWLIHNRKLDEDFAKARKRLQRGHGFGPNQNVTVSSHSGFVLTESWKTLESLATDGIKPGNLPSTWLGKPQSGELNRDPFGHSVVLLFVQVVFKIHFLRHFPPPPTQPKYIFCEKELKRKFTSNISF